MALTLRLIATSFIFAGTAQATESLLLRVIDPQGGVIPGAAIEVRSLSKGARPISVVTDQQGTVRVNVDSPATIQATAPGFDRLTLRIETEPAGDLTLRLVPASVHTTIEVAVRDGRALEGTRESTAFEIDRGGARTVYDAVDRLVPSAYVTRRGVMGYGIASASGAVSIRGIGGSPNTQLLVVVEGRPDYQGLMGHPIPDFYSLNNVDVVSIIQGPASVLYGNGAMGGAIEIRPVTRHEGISTQLSLDFGSYCTGQYRLNHGRSLEHAYYNLGAGIEHTNGDRPNSAFHNQDGALSLGYDLSSVWKASFHGRYGHFSVEDPGTVAQPVAGHWARVGRGGFSLNLENAGSQTWGSARFFSSRGHHMIWDGFRSVDRMDGLRLHQHWLIKPKLTVDGGTDMATYGGRARNIKSNLDYGEHEVTDAAGFTRVHYEPVRGLTLNGGLRYHHSSTYGGIVASEAGVAWRMPAGLSLSAAAARGFRNPTLRELYLFPAPNPLLQPESLWNYQATLHARLPGLLTAWVTIFHADVRDLIVTTGRYPNITLQNTGRATNRGFELNGRWQPSRWWGLSTGYAFLRSTNLAPYVPHSKINYSFDLMMKGMAFSLGGVSVGKTWPEPGKTTRLGAYTVVTMKWLARISNRINLSVMLDNLLNQDYQVITGYTMPGINAMAGVHFRF